MDDDYDESEKVTPDETTGKIRYFTTEERIACLKLVEREYFHAKYLH
jgi:hypothetical protein